MRCLPNWRSIVTAPPAVPHHCTVQHLATSGNSVNKMPPTQTLLKTLPTLAIHPGPGKVEVESTAPHGQCWFEIYNVCARMDVSIRANPRPGNIREGGCSCLSSSGQKQGLDRVKCSQNVGLPQAENRAGETTGLCCCGGHSPHYEGEKYGPMGHHLNQNCIQMCIDTQWCKSLE